ncbi:CHAD domain-containing protein [Streptomyces sp. NPDC087425]|uniref:CYTH and CHAD domain-containing protein n=1 Tax=Streptomyces sp. NPDC087425 TaxID=3365787 RepID=UPI0037F5F84F
MADTKREIERKYASDDSGLPDLTGVAGVVAVVDKGVVLLDATYYDTADGRLGAASLTLRRRTGGTDAGWHLKVPVAPGVRDEIHAPLSDTVPDELAGLVRSRVRDAELLPVMRLRSERDLRHLVDADGTLLAEVSVDLVLAERLTGGDGVAQWTEIEVELADGADPAVLDTLDTRLRTAGVRPAASASKVARALAETAPKKKRAGKQKPAPEPVTAGDHVLAYVREQREALLALDPAVRRDVPDAVHRMRVATRRLRSTFRSYPEVLDRAATDPLADELKWLAGELGVDRDREVVTERLVTSVEELPGELLAGPVGTRLRTWSQARHGGSRERLTDVLDGARYLELLVALDGLVAEPPFRKAAGGKPGKVISRAVRKELGKLDARVQEALELAPGGERDVALHEARKKAKRVRYAAEAAVAALDGPAKTLVKSVKSVQSLLGEHQDSVMIRAALCELAEQAHADGENTFTYGVLYGREEQRAARVETELPGVWAGVRGLG